MKAVPNKNPNCSSVSYGTAQKGVGLIEVLIALVIFALGVVGMAGLQLRTLSITMDSSQRTYVVSKSQDIADKIRSNGIPASDYLSDTPYNAQWCTANENLSTCADDAVGELSAACSAADMTRFDLYDSFCAGVGSHKAGSLKNEVTEWEVLISCAYPDPVTGTITSTTACNEPGATVSITTSWFARTAVASTDNDGNAAIETDSMTLSFVP